MATEKNPDAKVAWEGDSLDVVKAFPPAVRQEIGSTSGACSKERSPTTVAR